MSPPEVWGPPIWTFFHKLAENINEEHFNSKKNELFSYIKNICALLPCPECSKDATVFLAKISLTNINNKDKLKNLFYVFHNYVNRKTHKPFFNINNIDIYKKYRLIPVINNFLYKYNTKGNMKLLSDTFQRQFIITHFKSWIKKNIYIFLPSRVPSSINNIEDEIVSEFSIILDENEISEDLVRDDEYVTHEEIDMEDQVIKEPVTQEPVVEEPVVEEPEEPVVEEPEEPVVEEPVTQEPVTQEPVVEEPVVEEPVVEEPVVEEPVVEETHVEEPVVEEPVVEEPVVEETLVEEPVVEETLVEEPVVEEPEEPVVEETLVEEPVVEEPVVVVEEPVVVVEEPVVVVEEPVVVVEEPVVEEPVTEELVVEEPVTEEQVVEEPKESIIEEPVITTESYIAVQEVFTEDQSTKNSIQKPIFQFYTAETITQEPITREPITQQRVENQLITENLFAEEHILKPTANIYSIQEPILENSNLGGYLIKPQSINDRIIEDPILGAPLSEISTNSADNTVGIEINEVVTEYNK